MKVVIVGGGDIGKDLAQELGRRQDNEVTIIERDKSRSEEIAGDVDALILTGDGTDPAILKKADLQEAEALVAVTGVDAINTVIAMLGSRLGVPRIIVKLNESGLWAACEEIGVTRIIAPKLAATANILSTLYGSERLDLSLVGRGGLRLADLEVQFPDEREISELEVPRGVLIVAVQREGELRLPQGVKLARGDILFVLVENDRALQGMKDLLNSEPA